MSDRMQRLKDKLDNPPLSWVPTGDLKGLDPDKCIEGTEIFGTVDEVDDSRISDFGPFRMVTLLTPEGTRVAVAALGTVLRKRLGGPAVPDKDLLAVEGVHEGDAVGIRYTGRKPSSKSGQEDYHDYSVAIERSTDRSE